MSKKVLVVMREDLLNSLQTRILREKGRIRKGDLSNEINNAVEMYLKRKGW